MKIFIPSGIQEIELKSEWLLSDSVAVKTLKKFGVEFGFEIKGSTQGLENAEMKFPFGIHLPADTTTAWQDCENRKPILDRLRMLAKIKQKPLYANLHGTAASWAINTKTDGNERFVSGGGALNYLLSFNELFGIITRLQDSGIRIALENTPFVDYIEIDKVTQPITFLNFKVGTLSSDLLLMKEKTGCEIIFDLEHMAFFLNFAGRKFHYAGLPKKIPENLSKEEKLLLEQIGIFLRTGFVPVLKDKTTLELEIRKTGAKIYHLCGTSDGKWLEYQNSLVLGHQPIKIDDETFRQYLRVVLEQKPEILVLEAAGSDDNPCWNFRQPRAVVQRESLENFCQILAEELLK